MERKLRNRKRKFPKGYAIRVSDLVYETLNKERRKRSWDTFLRCLFGLPDRAGNSQPLVEGMLETMTGKFLLRLPDETWRKLREDAYEIAILAAAKRNVKMVSKPLRMREIP